GSSVATNTSLRFVRPKRSRSTRVRCLLGRVSAISSTSAHADSAASPIAYRVCWTDRLSCPANVSRRDRRTRACASSQPTSPAARVGPTSPPRRGAGGGGRGVWDPGGDARVGGAGGGRVGAEEKPGNPGAGGLNPRGPSGPRLEPRPAAVARDGRGPGLAAPA